MLSLVYNFGYAQEPLSITGLIRNGNGENLPQATVILIGQIDTLKTLTNNKGIFIFKVPSSMISSTNTILEVSVTMQGYKEFRTFCKVTLDRHNYFIPIIALSLEYEELVPVTVMGTKPITIHEDTVEYRAAAYKLRAGAELQRLMKQLPGIDWDTAGNIIVDGKKIVRLMIDGQNFAGGDIKAALKNIPADIIEKVQVIDDYGDKARLTGVKSGESEKALNVVLKEDKHNGNITRFDAALGDKRRYNSTLFSEFFAGDRQFTENSKFVNLSPSGDLRENLNQLTYANKWNSKWFSNGTLSVWGDTHASSNSMIQDNYLATTQLSQEQTNKLSGSNENEMIEFAQKYVPDANFQIQASTFIAHYYNKESAINDYLSREQDSGFNKLDSGHTGNLSRAYSQAIGADFHLEKTSPHNGQKMSVGMSYRYKNKQLSENNYSQIKVLTDSINTISSQHYFVNTSEASQEVKSNLSYYFPISRKSLLEIEYAWNYSSERNDKVTQTPDSITNIRTSIDSLSNNYLFVTTYNIIHAGYLIHANKLNIDIGIDAQSGNQFGNTAGKVSNQSYHYYNLLPSAQLSYFFSDRKKLNFSYNGSSDAPSLQQIQPLLDLTNQQYPVEGNPSLKPSYVHSATVGYEQSSLKTSQYWRFATTLSFTTTSNMIVENVLHPHDTSNVIQETTYANASGCYSLTGHYEVDLPAIFNNRIRISASGTLGSRQDVIMTDNHIYNGQGRTLNQAIQVRLIIPDVTEAEVSTAYSYTVSKYPMNEGSYSYPGLNWDFHWRQEFLQKWSADYNMSQVFTGMPGKGLQANPALLNLSVQRDLFSRNQMRLTFSINDLLNTSSAISQNITATGMTQSRSNLIGRYFLLGIVFKLEKFRKIKHD